MHFPTPKQLAALALGALAVIALWRWVLPVALPFALGALVAVAAEPMVRPLSRRLPRSVAAGLAVSATLLGLLTLLVLLTALLFRQLGQLTDQVPALIRRANDGLGSLQRTLTDLSGQAPKSLQPLLLGTVEDLFDSSGTVVESFLRRLPAAASAVLGYLADSALAVGTGCLSAYMISARLPRLRALLSDPPPESLWGRLLGRLQSIRHALWGWLKAQAKLSGLCFLILLSCFLVLGIPYAPLWALLTALVDAVPLLGTGIVLLPWSLICFLEKQTFRAVGLLATYAATFLSRTTLEPRLVGRQLGLDPLLTLMSLYAGYRFWGVGGMLLSPVLCVVLKEAVTRDPG